jgi:hypothetical protein
MDGSGGIFPPQRNGSDTGGTERVGTGMKWFKYFNILRALGVPKTVLLFTAVVFMVSGYGGINKLSGNNRTEPVFENIKPLSRQLTESAGTLFKQATESIRPITDRIAKNLSAEIYLNSSPEEKKDFNKTKYFNSLKQERESMTMPEKEVNFRYRIKEKK